MVQMFHVNAHIEIKFIPQVDYSLVVPYFVLHINGSDNDLLHNIIKTLSDSMLN